MKKIRAKKRRKRIVREPLNRRVAQLMIEIQDELKPLNEELNGTKKLNHRDLTKLVIEETQVCLNQLLTAVQFK